MPSNGCTLEILAAMLGLLACGSTEIAPPAVLPPACGYGEVATASGCCPPGTTPQADDSCAPAGIRATTCADGFEPGVAGTCEPVLPAEPCEQGTVAVPGDAECHPVALCGEGRWGNIPLEGSVEFVDAAFTGTSTGDETHPWVTIGDAVTAAEPGAVVAIAAGTYVEDVVVDKPLTLWGVCPALVQLVGVETVPGQGALSIVVGAGSSEVRGMGISGPSLGIAVSGAQLSVDRCWIHETGSIGVAASAINGDTECTVSDSLVENATTMGAYTLGSHMTLNRSAIRDALPDAEGNFGAGALAESAYDQRGSLTINGSLVARTFFMGVFGQGADVVIDASVIQDVSRGGAENVGRGVNLQFDPTGYGLGTLMLQRSMVRRCDDVGVFLGGATGLVESVVLREAMTGIAVEEHPNGSASFLAMRSSVVEDNRALGVFVGRSDATIERSVVRRTQADGGVSSPGAIHVQDNRGPGDLLPPRGSTLTVRGSTLLDNAGHGIVASGSHVVLASTLIADHGRRGVAIQNNRDHGTQGTLMMTASAVERCSGAGIFVAGSTGVLSNVVVRDTVPNEPDTGRGLIVQSDPQYALRASVDVEDSLFDANVEAGVFMLDSELHMTRCDIGHTASTEAGEFGDGIVVASIFAPENTPAYAVVVDSRIHDNPRAGLASFGAHVLLQANVLACNKFHINEESEYQGVMRPPVFLGCLDGGFGVCANSCGCGDAFGECSIVSSGLLVPAAIE